MAPPGPPLPSHLVRLTDGWALWRTVCLRGAGFALDRLEALGAPGLAEAADLANSATVDSAGADAAFTAEFARATGRYRDALRAIARDPAFREAIAWQNRQVLDTGLDALLRLAPGAVRNADHRRRETLVATYLQRYCAKNDTIGFFGPVGWASIGGPEGIRIVHAEPAALVSARTVYLEGWAVTSVIAPHTAALRPWLVPRRMPFLRVEGDQLRAPLAPPTTLTAAQAAVLRACDGERTAREVAAVVLADPASGPRTAAEVDALLDALCAAHHIAWQPEVAPQDTRPEQTMRARLGQVTDRQVRDPALAGLDELCAARDALGSAAGDPRSVAAAMADLEATFTRLAGAAPTRRAGQLYAGRTLAYEDCRRAGAVEIGEPDLDGMRAALGLVLDSAKWFTAAGAALYRRLFHDIHRRRSAELASSAVPFVDFFLRARDLLFDPPARLTGPLVGALQRRWADLLDLPAGQRRVRRLAGQLAPHAADAFPPGEPGWPAARQHSPDLLIAADRDGVVEWVLGELHPGINTMRYATWVAHHPAPDELRAAVAADLGRPVVYAAETQADGGLPARLSNALVGPGDLRLVFGPDSFGHDPAASLPVGECDLVEVNGDLRVRHRDGHVDLDVIEALADLIGPALAQQFRILAPAAHTPRVAIDSLVVSRESWTLTAEDIPFADTADEAARYRAARAWAARYGLPRHVFLRYAGERKPIHADLTSLASVDLIARSVRRARRHSGPHAPVTVTEMLPTPDQTWLTDATGRRYCAELRMVAVDTRRSHTTDQPWELTP